MWAQKQTSTEKHVLEVTDLLPDSLRARKPTYVATRSRSTPRLPSSPDESPEDPAPPAAMQVGNLGPRRIAGRCAPLRSSCVRRFRARRALEERRLERRLERRGSRGARMRAARPSPPKPAHILGCSLGLAQGLRWRRCAVSSLSAARPRCTRAVRWEASGCAGRASFGDVATQPLRPAFQKECGACAVDEAIARCMGGAAGHVAATVCVQCIHHRF